MYSSAALALVVIGSLPFCVARPWIGVLMWSWLSYMNPHRLTWSFAYDAPLAQLVAIATLVGLPFALKRASLPKSREVYLLALLWAVYAASTLFALYPESAWERFETVSKILLMTFLTLLLFQDVRRLKTLLWVVALSIGFFGIKGGIWAIMTGGQYMVFGPPASFIAGNTEIGLALNMVLPLLLVLRREASRPWVRHAMLAAFVLCLIASLMTYSRGALLGLAIVVAALLLRVRAKIALVVLLAVGIAVAPALIPEHWFTRMDTIATYQQDESAQTRLTAWGVAYSLALERPLGGGFRTLTAEVWSRFVPGWDRHTDAHSIYFQVLAEHGFVGLAVFLALILSTLATLRSVKPDPAREPELAWLGYWARMLEVAFYAYLVSGAFLGLSYFDLFYQLVAIAVVLKVLFQRERARVRERGAPASMAPAAPRPTSGPLRPLYAGPRS